MNEQQNYALEYYQNRKKELDRERRYTPVILGDENDTENASILWLVLGFLALGVEFGFAYFFFTKILYWDTMLSVVLATALVAVSAIGTELLLEFEYGGAQNATNHVRNLEKANF